MCDSKGILYIAIGKDYIRQAKLSAKIAKKTHPDLNITLITTENVESPYIDQVKTIIKKKDRSNSAIKKLKISGLRETPYEKTLYIDTDAYIINNIDEVFDMLETVDLALAVDPTEFGLRHLDRNPDHIPECFPEYQTGIIAYQNNKSIENLFRSWEKYHGEKNIQRDQVSFRQAMFTKDVCTAFSSLSLLYNYPVALTQRVEGEVKIIHDTRNDLETVDEIERYSQVLNNTNKERVMFSHGYGGTKIHAPLHPNVNFLLSILNSFFYMWAMFKKLLYTTQRDGVPAAINKVIKKILSYFVKK